MKEKIFSPIAYYLLLVIAYCLAANIMPGLFALEMAIPAGFAAVSLVKMRSYQHTSIVQKALSVSGETMAILSVVTSASVLLHCFWFPHSGIGFGFAPLQYMQEMMDTNPSFAWIAIPIMAAFQQLLIAGGTVIAIVLVRVIKFSPLGRYFQTV